VAPRYDHTKLHKNRSSGYVGRNGLAVWTNCRGQSVCSWQQYPPLYIKQIKVSLPMAHLYVTLGTYYLPHRHASGIRLTRPSVKYWQTSGSYRCFSCSSNGSHCTCEYWRLLGRVRKTAKNDLSVVSIRPFIRPHVTTRLAMDVLFMKLDIWDFRKSVETIQVLLKSDKNNGYLAWRFIYSYDISRNISQS
jgi:hypothetical protein